MDYNILSTNPYSDYMCKGIQLSNIQILHKQGYKGKGQRICIIDTGSHLHSFIVNNIVTGKNFTNEGTPEDYTDKNNHGSFCIGEVIQVAPECEVVVAKALNSKGKGSMEGIINAFKYALEQNVHVISMSLGSTKGDEELHDLVKEATKRGILVCTSAGNNGDGNADTDEYGYPASYQECVNVGAVNQDLSIARYSNSNEWVDIVAVGTDIVSVYFDNKWCKSSGTS